MYSMKELTEKQEQVLKFITQTIKDRAYPPTIREIGEHFDITAKGAYDHLKALEKKGYIRTSKNQSRAIEILRHSAEVKIPAVASSIPLVGRVAAGTPILAEENIEDYITVPDELTKKGTVYALKVVGDSMIGSGIYDGDIAIILKREVARNGEIVVAMVDGEATLKTYYKEEDCIRLEPSNKVYKPIRTQKAQILGKLIGLYRFY